MSQNSDSQTISYYNSNANEITKRYETAVFEEKWHKQLQDFIFYDKAADSLSLLDIGCGSGRDLAYWLKKGVDGYGIDASKEMINYALIFHPELKDRVNVDSLPLLKSKKNETFDAVICSAVLMHLNTDALEQSIKNINRILKRNGKFIASIPLNGPETDMAERCPSGRLFTKITEKQMSEIIKKNGFEIIKIHCSEDSLKRQNRSWITFFCQKNE